MPNRVVDIHNHGVPAGFVERVKVEGARHGYTVETLATPKGKTNDQYTEILITPEVETGIPLVIRRIDADHRRTTLSDAGVDVSIQSINPRLFGYTAGEQEAIWECKAINDAIWEDMQKSPRSLVGMAHVPLQYPVLAARELERVASDYGMTSAMIATKVGGENLDCASLLPFWEAANDLGTLLFVHPHYNVSSERWSRYHLRNLIGNPLETSTAITALIFGGVIEKFSNVKFCFAHAGGYAPWIRGRWRHGYEVRSEPHEEGVYRPFDDYFGQLYFDSLIHDEEAFLFLVRSVGADRVLLGTDYPADMGDWTRVDEIRQSHELDGEDIDKILGDNATRLLDLKD